MHMHENLTEAEWLKLRTKNINSTESSALFGLSPYMTEFELYHRKTNLELGDGYEDNFRMKCGRLLEPVIAQLALDEIGCKGEPFKEYLEEPQARTGSSFDWQITSGKYEGWLLECKNVDYLVHRDQWLDDEAPIHIEFQVQHQLLVSGRKGCIIACLVGGNTLHLIYRERDEEFISAIRNKIAKFWKAVDNKVEPDPDFERDANLISEMYRNTEKDKVFDAYDKQDITEAISKYKENTDRIKKLDTANKAIKAEIFRAADNASVLLCDGFKVSMGTTKDSEPKTVYVTPEMVGTEINVSQPRKGYRMFKLTEKK